MDVERAKSITIGWLINLDILCWRISFCNELTRYILNARSFIYKGAVEEMPIPEECIDFPHVSGVFLYSTGESHCPCETAPTPPGAGCNYHWARSHLSLLHGFFKGQHNTEGETTGTAPPTVNHRSLQGAASDWLFVSGVLCSVCWEMVKMMREFIPDLPLLYWSAEK